MLRVAPSCHGGYDGARDTAPLDEEGNKPHMVYHKDGAGTHCFRFAKDEDGLEEPENFSGDWYRSPLVGWEGWPNDDVWQAVVDQWPSGVCPKWLDSEFEGALRDAKGDADFDFDPATDG